MPKLHSVIDNFFFHYPFVLSATLGGAPGRVQWAMSSFLKHPHYDDICLLSYKVSVFAQMTLDLKKDAKRVGRKVKINKSKFSINSSILVALILQMVLEVGSFRG